MNAGSVRRGFDFPATATVSTAGATGARAATPWPVGRDTA